MTFEEYVEKAINEPLKSHANAGTEYLEGHKASIIEIAKSAWDRAVMTTWNELAGLAVSMDVSTGDHDAHHRLFGTVIGFEGGVIQCEMTEDNQDCQPAPEVAMLIEALSRCRHQASYSIGEIEALEIQLGRVRDIANEALAAHHKTEQEQEQ